MSLETVMDEVAAQLDTITGLRVHPHPIDKISPPAGIVSYPEEINYVVESDGDTVRYERIPVFLVVGRAVARAARDAVSAYVDVAGPKSVKASFEAHSWQECDYVTVTSCTFDVITIAGVDYLAAQFELDIVVSA